MTASTSPIDESSNRGGGFFRRNRRLLAVVGVAVVAVVAWLALGYFEIQKSFIDDKVNEAMPAGGAAAAATGTFVSRSHTTTGTASVIDTGGAKVIRLNDLNTENGPDVRVYLAAGVDANADEGTLNNDFVDLGALKGNIGSQNYAVPTGTDVAKYRTVVLWCRRFSVAFAAADLTP